jgi:octaprenyl-diphosphate synthase
MGQALAQESLLKLDETHEMPTVADRLALLPGDVRAQLAEVEAELQALEPRPRGPARASARHVLDTGGKRVRPILCLLAAESCAPGRRLPELIGVAQATELIHAASLLHDDVIDLGEWRRGRPSARLIYGNAASVLGGNLLLVHALQLVSRTGLPSLMDSTLGVLREMIAAESVQLAARGRLSLTEDEYFEIVGGKTASVFAWSAESGARAAGGSDAVVEALREFGYEVGVTFQLVDDLLDLVQDPAQLGKSVWQDLQTGTLTHPLVHAAQRDPERIAALLAGNGVQGEDLGKAVHALAEETGGLEASRREIERRTERALRLLEPVPAGPARDVLALVAQRLSVRAS